MSDCPICDGTGTDPDHDPCDCDDGTPCPKCLECNGIGVDPVNRCDFCGAESDDGCLHCDVSWCGGCRAEHVCPYEAPALLDHVEGCSECKPHPECGEEAYCTVGANIINTERKG